MIAFQNYSIGYLKRLEYF